MAGFFVDVHEQPDALRRVVKAMPADLRAVSPFADRLGTGEFSSVIFTGMGSSLSACIPATILLAEKGIPAQAIETSELLAVYRPLIGSKTLLVMVSQSGRSAEIVRLIDELKGAVPFIGVHNAPDSPLAKQSAVAVPLYAGDEATVSTKTYTSTLAVMHLMALVLTDHAIEGACREIQDIADTLAGLLPAFDKQVPQIAREITPVRFIEYLGRGASRASAVTAALITKETAKMPTEGMAGGQFRHGPWELLAPDITVCLFGGARAARPLDLALSADINARQGKTIMIGPEAASGSLHIVIPDLNPMLAPLVEIVPVQLLAAELARAKGIMPGEFRFGGKVTTIE